jgi:hypothetical protein
MQAARAAFPACAFHAVTAFGLERGFALAGAAINASVASEAVKKRMKARRRPIECATAGDAEPPRPR